ncbi:MAG: hypothetical protein HKO81_08535 [Flavobacteriaceae bacterium]|nr:hypothetical protein [Bacteroidia bacterium]NNL16672.1 hypothetical protein [Flavobacteriaceae bacterium]
MKKMILIVLALVSVQVSAQDRGPDQRRGNRMDKELRMSDLTAEEMAQLQTKKMVLHLDLSESQQKQIEKLNLESAKGRKAKMEARQAKMKEGKGEKPNKEERLKIMNEKLDNQIEMKQKMKKILNDEQFEKWAKNQGRKKSNFKKKGQERRKQRS